MEDLNKEKQVAIGALRDYWLVGLVIAILVVLVGGTVSFVTKSLEKKQDIENKNKELESITRDLTFLEKNKEDVHEINRNLAIFLPNEKPVFETLMVINDAAKANGVVVADLSSIPGRMATNSATVNNAGGGKKELSAADQAGVPNKTDTTGILSKPTAAKQEKKIQSLKFTLQVKGGFDGLSNFIRQLAQSTPLIDVGELRLNSGGIDKTGKAGGNFLGELDVIVYWMPKLTSLPSTNMKQVDTKHKAIYDRLLEVNKGLDLLKAASVSSPSAEASGSEVGK
jgi:hypothetical protein